MTGGGKAALAFTPLPQGEAGVSRVRVPGGGGSRSSIQLGRFDSAVGLVFVFQCIVPFGESADKEEKHGAW